VLIKNHTFIAIDVSKKLSQEAENLASQFNKSIAKTAKAPGISNKIISASTIQNTLIENLL
jgi:hypothetical protein